MILSKIHTSCFHKYNFIIYNFPVPVPGQVVVSVNSITASSISLSWSVASDRVASWEVVWRPTDRGTESTSGSLPGNTYTIHHLDSSTIYTVTVTATNVAGTTDSTPILFSTGMKLFCVYKTHNTFSIVPSINNTLNTSPLRGRPHSSNNWRNSCRCINFEHHHCYDHHCHNVGKNPQQ